MWQAVKQSLGEQNGSQVAQAAGIAIFVAVLTAGIFGSLGSWQVGVVEALRCYVVSFDSGGCSGAGSGTDLQAIAEQAVALARRHSLAAGAL